MRLFAIISKTQMKILNRNSSTKEWTAPTCPREALPSAIVSGYSEFMPQKPLLLLSFFTTLGLILGCASSPRGDRASLSMTEPPLRPQKVHELPPEENSEPSPQDLTETLPVWSYSGVTGPESWGRLREEFSLCEQGREQSPINLIWSPPKKADNLFIPNYQKQPLKMIHTGWTLRLPIDGGSSAKIHGEEFELKTIHFYTPSEHRISGREYPLEIQFHHESSQGQKVVVASLAEVGTEHLELRKILSQPLQTINHEYIAPIDWAPEELLPKEQTHYKYKGSLTTPPCTEGLLWVVFNTPIELSQEQLVTLRTLVRPNNRPLQPLNSRKVENY